jgi:hypothetical protein
LKLEENIRKTLEGIGIGNSFLKRTSISQKIRVRIEKWDCIKLKSFCTTKVIITRIKDKTYRMRDNLC